MCDLLLLRSNSQALFVAMDSMEVKDDLICAMHDVVVFWLDEVY